MRPEDELNQGFARLHPVEAARQLETYEPEEAANLLAAISISDSAAVLGCCQPLIASQVIQYLSPETIVAVINELPTSMAFLVFRQLPPELQAHVTDRLSLVEGIKFRRALNQPEQTAGSLADPRILTFPEDISVGEAIALLKRNPNQAGYYVYVVDRDGKLKGVVTMKTLFFADSQEYIASMMNNQVVAIPSNLTNEEIIGHPHWQQFPTLPVVDHDGVFLGMLRYRTLQQVIEETATYRPPGSLPTALMQLWEAYSLVGLRVMTQLSGLTDSGQEDKPLSPTRSGEPS